MRSIKPLLLAVLCQLTFCLLSGAVAAAPIEVNFADDLPDFDPGDGVCDADIETIGPQCSLRAAVQTANALVGPDTVLIPPGFAIDLELVGSSDAALGDLDIEEDLEILGFVGEPPLDSADLPILDANALGDRHFDVEPGVSLTIRGLQLVNGSTPGSGGAIRAGSGAVVVVDWSSFTENQALGGGAIDALSALVSITDSDFLGNVSTESSINGFGSALRVVGGTIPSELLIERSSFRDNQAIAGAGRQIFLAGVQATLDNVTVDGQDWVELPGLQACYGIQFRGGDLLIRNSTLTRHDSSSSCSELLIQTLDEGDRVRMAHSVVFSNEESCRIENSEAADIVFYQSMMAASPDCNPYFDQVSVDEPDLMELMPDEGRLSYSRSAVGPYSNIVDAGLAADSAPDDLELACLETDQRGLPRPVDGDADLVARCDYGAVERAEPQNWLVNTFSTDAEDVAPGDGECDFNPFAPGSQCTLRAAVMEANAVPGIQIIRFAPTAEPVVLTIPPEFEMSSAAHGDLDITESVSIQGTVGEDGRPTRVLQTAMDRIFELALGEDLPSRVYLRDLMMEGGQSAESGGALRVNNGQTWVFSSRFVDNSAEDDGGAIFLEAGQLHLHAVDLVDNGALGQGSAIAVDGGAQFVLTQSSIRNHSSTDSTGSAVPVLWSGADADVTLINSSVFDNSLGMRFDIPARLVLRQNTIADNGAEGIVASLSAVSELIFDGNILEQTELGAVDCQFTDLIGAQILSYDYNLSSDDSCTLTTDTSFMADPSLGNPRSVPSSLTFALRPGYGTPGQPPSAALDRMPNDLCEPVDQSGQARPIDLADVIDVDGLCDLGALEVRRSDSLFGDRFGGF